MRKNKLLETENKVMCEVAPDLGDENCLGNLQIAKHNSVRCSFRSLN